MLAERVAIIGVGLIGGSLGLRWRRSGTVARVVGFGRDEDRLRRAEEVGAIHHGSTDLREALEGADLVVLAAPIQTCIALAPRVVSLAAPGCIITDVGSTKREITAAMCSALEAAHPPETWFLGGHPMAGSERSGVEAADPYLFEQAVWALCPTEQTPDSVVDRVSALVRSTGAHPVLMDCAMHDRRVAAVSHVPQLVAVALAEATGRAAIADAELLALAGGGFRDTTRIASSPAEMWLDVLETNRDEVVRGVERIELVLAALKQAVADADRASIRRHFAAAGETRRQIPLRQKGLLPAYHDLVLYVPDRPGVIGTLAQALGERSINIQDIEILRLREGEGGTLRLGFATAELASAAQGVLADLGYLVQRR